MAQPKAALFYVFDSASNKWVPAEGTAAGFTGVTLETEAGAPISDTDGLNDNAVSAHLLDVAGFNYGYDATGANWDRIRSFANNADALATVTLGLLGVRSFLTGFNGATYDRLRSFAGNADAVVAPTLGLLGIAGFNYIFNGTTWDLARGLASNADAQVAAQVGLTGVVSRSEVFNGTTWDRARSNSAATLSATTQPFAGLVASPGEWSINHTPAAATQATITRAAGATGVRHICRSITVTLIGLAAAAEETILVNLRDGATGAGTILWSTRLLVTGTTGSETGVTLSNLNIFGSAATAMTLEFAGAGGANTFETVAVSGYDTI